MLIDLHFFADDIRVAGESLAPVGISQNDNGVGARIEAFGWKNEASVGWLDSKRRKIVTGDAAHDAVIGFLVDAEFRECYSESESIGEGAGLVANILEIRV